jgi:rRNA maturation protein Nop10
MSYCPKCGNKIDETMTFCPRCGTSLKGATPSQSAPAQPYRRNEKAEKNEKREKQEKNEHPEKSEKQEKGEYGFIGFLIGGLVLIVLGLFSLLRFSGYFTDGQSWAIMLLIIGIVIIGGAIYVAIVSRKHFPEPH